MGTDLVSDSLTQLHKTVHSQNEAAHKLDVTGGHRTEHAGTAGGSDGLGVLGVEGAAAVVFGRIVADSVASLAAGTAENLVAGKDGFPEADTEARYSPGLSVVVTDSPGLELDCSQSCMALRVEVLVAVLEGLHEGHPVGVQEGAGSTVVGIGPDLGPRTPPDSIVSLQVLHHLWPGIHAAPPLTPVGYPGGHLLPLWDSELLS